MESRTAVYFTKSVRRKSEGIQAGCSSANRTPISSARFRTWASCVPIPKIARIGMFERSGEPGDSSWGTPVAISRMARRFRQRCHAQICWHFPAENALIPHRRAPARRSLTHTRDKPTRSPKMGALQHAKSRGTQTARLPPRPLLPRRRNRPHPRRPRRRRRPAAHRHSPAPRRPAHRLLARSRRRPRLRPRSPRRLTRAASGRTVRP